MRSGALAWILSAALLLAASAFAEEEQTTPSTAEAAEEEPIDLEALREDRKRRGSLYPVGSRISRYLGAAAKAADEGEPEEGRRLLAKLNPGRLNPYERALVYRLEAFISYTAGDQEGAIEAFEKVLGEEILPLKDENRIRFNIAQLHAGLQQWHETIAAIKRWLRYVEDPDPLGYYLVAISYFQLEDLDNAVVWAEKAVDLSPEPKEGWLQLLAALYIQKTDYANATPVLEELVMRFPKKLYWVQLSLIYGARENYRNSLAVQQVAYAQELLTEDKELRRLARSYLYDDLPYPAAKVLAKGLEDGLIEADADAYELLANSWIAAREYDEALGPLQRAAELSEDGNLFVRLAQVHMQREEWNDAVAMLKKGVDKGGLKDTGHALVLLGICHYNDERPVEAASYFARAKRHDGSRDEAERWLKHLATETEGRGEAEGGAAAAALPPDQTG